MKNRIRVVFAVAIFVAGIAIASPLCWECMAPNGWHEPDCVYMPDIPDPD